MTDDERERIRLILADLLGERLKEVPLEKFVSSACERFKDLIPASTGLEPGTPIGEIYAQALKDLQARIAGTVDKGVLTGFYDLDAKTGGFQPGQLIVIAGRPGMGKSAIAADIADYAARCGYIILLVSLEMSKLEVGKRGFSQFGDISSDKIRSHQLTEMEIEHLKQFVRGRKDLPIWVNDNVALTVPEVRSIVLSLKPNMLIVDYSQLLKSEERKFGGNREQEVAAISRGLKALAMEGQVPVIAVAQLNRESEGRQDKRPVLSDLRESGQLEQDADIVAMMYREAVYNKDAPEGEAELILRKHRNGPLGTVKLVWDQERMTFLNATQTTR